MADRDLSRVPTWNKYSLIGAALGGVIGGFIGDLIWLQKNPEKADGA